MDFRLGLKQIPAGPSRVRGEAKAHPKRTGEVLGTGCVGYAFGHSGYGGYATNYIYGPQTGLRVSPYFNSWNTNSARRHVQFSLSLSLSLSLSRVRNKQVTKVAGQASQ